MDRWIEVDFQKLRQNLAALRSFIQVPIMAVLKQDGYGLGAVPVGRFLADQGITCFGVTHIHEGVQLREGGIDAPILIFAPSLADGEDLAAIWDYRLTPSVVSLEAAQILSQSALERDKTLAVHIKIDTGMGRLGFTPGEMLAAAPGLQALPGLEYRGIYTHFSNAFENVMRDTKRQKDVFDRLLDKLAGVGLTFPVRHSANSPAALKFPQTHLDLVRIGSALLGGGTSNNGAQLVRAYRTRVRVLQVRRLQRGSYVGYSNTHRVKKDTNVAILPIGYTDGLGLQKKIDSFRFMDFLREQYHLLKSFAKPEHHVFYKGRPLGILGKTSMQLTVVDIGDLPLKPGDLVDVQLNPLLANGLERVFINQNQPSR